MGFAPGLRYNESFFAEQIRRAKQIPRNEALKERPTGAENIDGIPFAITYSPALIPRLIRASS